MVFHPLLTNWVTVLSRPYFSGLLMKMLWKKLKAFNKKISVKPKALLKLRCDIYCFSVHGACYSVTEGSQSGWTQLLLDKFMVTVAGLLFISEGAYKPSACANIFPESEMKLLMLIPFTPPLLTLRWSSCLSFPSLPFITRFHRFWKITPEGTVTVSATFSSAFQ